MSLTDPQLFDQLSKRISEEVATTVKQTVNGKVDLLTSRVNEAMTIASASAATSYHHSQESVRMNKDLLKKFDEYIKQDNAWKKEQEPYLKGMANINGFWKILIKVAVGIAALASAGIYSKQILISLFK